MHENIGGRLATSELTREQFNAFLDEDVPAMYPEKWESIDNETDGSAQYA